MWRKIQGFNKKNWKWYKSFNQEKKSSINSYCNTIKTPDGGSHENALKSGIVNAIKFFCKKNQISKFTIINTNDLKLTHPMFSKISLAENINRGYNPLIKEITN